MLGQNHVHKRETDRRTDRRTGWNQYTPLPNLSMREYTEEYFQRNTKYINLTFLISPLDDGSYEIYKISSPYPTDSTHLQFLNRFIHWFWLRIAQFTRCRLLAHGGCERSTGDAYSSYIYVHDPTSSISGFPCLSCTHFVLKDWLRFIIFILISIHALFKSELQL